ncbi:MAG: dihydroorotate dehydrogenase electron transfer subunit [Oscillospiraceae bacterium]|nr:dihydroorotate dehydrogenase electron transfer subunit [Oscillospiraceae bacterium]
MKEVLFDIIENVPLNRRVLRLRLRGDCSAVTAPGQFVNIKLDGCFLRRPFSVCDAEDDILTLCYRVKGQGTEALSRLKSGSLSILTGLGNGFDTEAAGDRPLLIAGGTGFTPIYMLAKRLKNPRVILGVNTASELLYEEEFRAVGAEVIVTTADGSCGTKGLVTDVMAGLDYSYFYACGAEAMYSAVNEVAVTEGEFSFEARMGCGFGACMGCTCETRFGSKRICRDGPVLKRSEIIWRK